MISHKQAALYYARNFGWAVLPLHYITSDGQCSCGERDCRNAGKHPLGQLVPNGLINASTSAELIEKWWSKFPEANIGIRTGGGLVVCDVDPRSGGDDTMRELEARFGPLPPTPQVITGGGGIHYYFRADAWVKSTSGVLGPGVDVKADGGYVVAPPSNHISGRRYEWDVTYRLSTVPLAELPAWIRNGEVVVKVEKGAPASKLPARWTEGQRNSGLIRYGGLLRRDGISEAGLEAELLAKNAALCDPPLSVQEVRAIVKSLMRPEYEPQESHGVKLLVAEREEASTPYSDISNGHRLAATYGNEFRYVPEWGWLLWDGYRWERDTLGRIHLKAEMVVRDLRREAEMITDTELRSKTMKKVAACESVQRLAAMVTVASRQPGVARRADEFDRFPWSLNCLNGTLDLRTGILTPHDRDELLTKLAPTVYDPDAKCPRFEQFLEEIFDADADLIAYVQRCFGYALTAGNLEDCLFILHGSGRNGKSTLVNTIRNVLGNDYTSECDPKLLLERRPDQPTNDLARLRGTRVVTVRELEEGGKRLAASLVKALTGRDTILARFLHKEFFEFRPEFTIFLATNHEPRITDTTHAMWARIRKIPFNITFPPEKQDKQLEAKLQDESAGILAWLVRGCLDWQQRGSLDEPKAVIEATELYRADQDPVGRFLKEETREDPMAETFISVQETYDRYVKWCEADGKEAFTKDWFTRKMREKGYVSRRATGQGAGKGRWYEGLVWAEEGV